VGRSPPFPLSFCTISESSDMPDVKQGFTCKIEKAHDNVYWVGKFTAFLHMRT